jgi:hypothetical protein
MLQQYEDKQAALQAAREAEERRRLELEQQQQREFEQRQREQAEKERLAQEQLLHQQQMMQYQSQAAQQAHELEREMLAMRGQYERDQLLLEQYDRVRAFRHSLVRNLIQMTTASQSSGGRTQWCYHPHQFANGIQGRADQATPGSSHPVAK